jgi:hypothetical protein
MCLLNDLSWVTNEGPQLNEGFAVRFSLTLTNGSYRKIFLGFFVNPFKTLNRGTNIKGLGYINLRDPESSKSFKRRI